MGEQGVINVRRMKIRRDCVLKDTNTFVFTFNTSGGGRVVRLCWVNFQCRGVLLIWITVGQGPTVLTVGAGRGCLDIYPFSPFSPSLWESGVVGWCDGAG